METASTTNQREKVPSADIMMSKEITPTLLELLLKRAQSQLPLKPTEEYSNSTRVVSSVDQLAEPTSITVLSLLDSETVVDKTTPSLETHGVDHGETRVTSGSPPTTTPAVSSNNHHTQLHEHQMKNI